MEECVFRAVPLALGALIGARYGRRRLGIAIAFVLQAVVFGAAHANYPGFPAYSRLVELFAAVDAVGGDLPALRAAADDPPARAVRSRADLDPAVPGRCARRRRAARAGDRGGARAACRRRAAPRAGGRVGEPAGERCATARGGRRRRRSPSPSASRHAGTHRTARGASAARAAGAGRRGSRRVDRVHAACAPTCRRLRSTATRPRRPRDAALAERGVVLGAEWTAHGGAAVGARGRDQRQWHAFVWREAGPARVSRARRQRAGAAACGTCASPASKATSPSARKNGASPSTGTARIRQVRHRLPEGRPGATLDPRRGAVARGARRCSEQLGSDAGALAACAAQIRRSVRRARDWVFAYVDPRVDVGKSGEARVRVAYRRRRGRGRPGARCSSPRHGSAPKSSAMGGASSCERSALSASSRLAIVAALVYAVRSRGARAAAIAARSSPYGALAVRRWSSLGSANNWPMRAFYLRTAEPLASQLLVSVLGAGRGRRAIGIAGRIACGRGGALRATGRCRSPPGRPASAVGLLASWRRSPPRALPRRSRRSCRRRSRCGRT